MVDISIFVILVVVIGFILGAFFILNTRKAKELSGREKVLDNRELLLQDNRQLYLDGKIDLAELERREAEILERYK